MSFQSPARRILRWSVVGMEGMWVKMFDPPVDSPDTPDEVAPNNPVPEVMAAALIQKTVSTPHTVQRDLMHGLKLPTWDDPDKEIDFMTFRDKDNDATGGGNWPGATIRVPRGVIFHCETSGHGPPPHTIHWHGIEPTPMNDGVGHCSVEIGGYTYQFQPNYIGTYFYHCHRNTVQHFEFGLYGMLLVEPPDAYFATQVLGVPIGRCRDNKRRTAANLSAFGHLGFDWKGGQLTDQDPWQGNPSLKFQTDPHAMTVAYDVEALWVPDDRDWAWSEYAPDARATFPQHGSIPGVNDNFAGNAGGGVDLTKDFFAFNDFNADYWYVTGVPVPARKGGTASIPPSLTIPAALNSGVAGMQVSVNAQINQTVLIRCLNAAYNSIEVSFPVDVLIIAWDGRALGVPPFGFNEPYLVPAGQAIRICTARRFDALIRSGSPVDSFATVKFINSRGEGIQGMEELLVTARIPIQIGTGGQPASYSVTGTMTNLQGAPLKDVSVTVAPVSLGGHDPQTVTSDVDGHYTVTGLTNASYTITPFAPGTFFEPPFRTVTINDANMTGLNFAVSAGPSVTLVANKTSPQGPDTAITFTATGSGGTGFYEYRYYLNDGSGTGFQLMRDYSPNENWVWTPSNPGNYDIFVEMRNAESQVLRDAYASINFFQIQGSIAPTGVTVTSDLASPQAPGTAITFSATAQGGAGPLEYRFYLNDGSGAGFVLQQDYSSTASWTWTPSAAGNYDLFVEVRRAGADVLRDAYASVNFYQIQAAIPPNAVSLTPSIASPQASGTQITFTATASGGSGPYEYRFYLNDGSGAGYVLQGPYSATNTFVWTPTAAGNYDVFVETRLVGSGSFRDAYNAVYFYQIQ